MKKRVLVLCLTVLSLSISCKNKSSQDNTSEQKENVVKCPNCGSQSLTSLEPGGRILECNDCGVGFDKTQTN
jgi:DNA-directed RNA polymerase subunit RPC12/RpoP